MFVVVVVKSIIFFWTMFSLFFFFPLQMSNKRRKSSNRGSGPRGKATGGSVKGALLARRVDWSLWCWSPTGFGSEEAALLSAGAVGHWAVVRVTGVTLCVTVSLSSGDALLLTPPWIVVSRVTDVMVDKGVGFLLVLIHFVFTVTSLWSMIERP